jgi:hypothetical protein
MRKHARRDSALAWIGSGARVTVPAYAKRYGVDHHTARHELTELGFPLPADAAKWAQRPPATPRNAARSIGEEFPEPDWIWEGGRRMFVVGYTSGGAPFGCYEDELDDHLPQDGPRAEVVGGEIVVSPCRTVDHNGMFRDVELACVTDGSFSATGGFE